MKPVELSNGIKIDIINKAISRDGKPYEPREFRRKMNNDHWHILSILITEEDEKVWKARLIKDVKIYGHTDEDKRGNLNQSLRLIRKWIDQDCRNKRTPQFIDAEGRWGGGYLIFKRNPNSEISVNAEKYKLAAPEIKEDFVKRYAASGKSYVDALINELIVEKSGTVPALIGNIGVGKSVIANEIGRYIADKHNFIYIWSSAKKREYRLDDLLEDVLESLLGQRLAHLLPYFKEGLNEEIVSQTLEKHKRCFLVLDSLEDIKPNELKKCLSWVGKEFPNSVVITSRRDSDYSKTYRIKEMSDDEAKAFIEELKKSCCNFDHNAEKIIKKVKTRNPAVLRRVVELLEAEFEFDKFNVEADENAEDKMNVKNLFKNVYDEVAKIGGKNIIEALLPSPTGINREELIKISNFSDQEDSFDQAISKLKRYKFVLECGNRYVISESESQIQDMIMEFVEK